jgi:hypothetical protein
MNPAKQSIDTAVQTLVAPFAMPTPIVNFEGIPNYWGGIPPDTIGDVGRNHYVQMVNVGFSIYTKLGTRLYGPANNNTLFRGFGGPCETTNSGDPVIVYDHLADRWVLTQFTNVFGGVGGTDYVCFAVSTSPDPLDTYYRYQIASPSNRFPDYFKVTVWPDAYYMTSREFAPGYVGLGAYAVDRAKMLVGDPTATAQYFHLDPATAISDRWLPSDLDGDPPPAGTPNYFGTTTDDGNGGPSDAFLIREFHVDWDVAANSTFNLVATLPTDPFDSSVCAGRPCIPQPGTSVLLDSLTSSGTGILWRLQYRYRGSGPGLQTLVAQQTVDAGSQRAGLRWYEIHTPGAGASIFQQGTFAPADTTHRWMGSIAMDKMGNIALGYSASSSTVYPSIWYTGRLSSDPPGQMAAGEAVLINGSGSQVDAANRWGDYSSMNVDPVDECTFWYTTEYYSQTSSRGWQTRIGSFKFPECTVGGSPTPVATPTGGTRTPTPSPQPSATACANSATFTGSITLSDPTHLNRPGRSITNVSTCTNVTTCTASVVDGFSRHYDTHTYTNNTGSSQCVTVNVDATQCGPAALFSVAYLGTFNPSNLCENYLADPARPGPTMTYSFTLDAGETVTILITESNENVGCPSYTVRINPCDNSGQPTATSTSTPVPVTATATGTATPCVPDYVVSTAVATMIVGGADVGNSCDDCTTEITLPFPVTVYGRTYITANVGSDGDIQFASNNPSIYDPNCLPVVGSGVNPPFASTIFAYYDDLRTDIVTCTACGIYTQTIGSAPNRLFVVRWYVTFFGTDTDEAQFEVLLRENSDQLSVIYGPSANSGLTASSGTQFNDTIFTQFSCDTAALTDGLQVNYDPTGCATPTPTATVQPTSTACTIEFSDVLPDSTFYTWIRCLACRGIISGYTDGTFRPGNDITRGQIAKMVSNAAGFSEDPGPQLYEDVPPGSPFYDWINRLSMRGHIGGYPCGLVPEEPCIAPNNLPYFRPNATSTRGQLAKIVSNAAGIGGTPTGLYYTDVPEDNPFYTWIMRLTTLGVMGGYPCGTTPEEPCDDQNRPYFRPFANVTRGQASKIVANTFFPGCQTPFRR